RVVALAPASVGRWPAGLLPHVCVCVCVCVSQGHVCVCVGVCVCVCVCVCVVHGLSARAEAAEGKSIRVLTGHAQQQPPCLPGRALCCLSHALSHTVDCLNSPFSHCPL